MKKTKLHILLVEDDADQAVIVGEYLKEDDLYDYDIVHVDKLKDAKHTIETTESLIQLIFLDLNLPDSKGNTTLSTTLSFSKQIPIIVLTSTEDTEQEFSALDIGAEEYLIKGSFVSSDLIRAVHHAQHRHKRIMTIEQERDNLRDILADIKLGNIDAILSHNSASRVIHLLNDDEIKELLEKVKRHHLELKHLATRDTLTQLYNRIEFEARAEETLSIAKREGHGFAVFFIDVDNFKDINDTYGHEMGDNVLKKISRLWETSLRDGDILGRLGGDEFGIIVPVVRQSDEASAVANKLIKSIIDPLTIADQMIEVKISIGIALYPKAANNAKDLLKHADIAMYRAKKATGSGFKFYTQAVQKLHLYRTNILELLRNALDNNEFHLVYQPIIDLKSKKMVGMEALIRWENPKIKSIGPDEFIPIAEESGLIVPIGDWVIKQALEQYAAWSKQFSLSINININLSIKQLLTEEIVIKMKSILDDNQIDPNKVLLELTETALITDIKHSNKILEQFKRYGLNFSMDDFGTGYSSMTLLKVLPLTEIKIDKSFTRDIMIDQNDAAIVKSIISLANNLNLSMVAEGIETKDQLDFLIKHGCKKGQGYYFSHPLDVDEMTNYLKKQEK
jgi:diguanylate cyclase (GGDEF)-like protein